MKTLLTNTSEKALLKKALMQTKKHLWKHMKTLLKITSEPRMGKTFERTYEKALLKKAHMKKTTKNTSGKHF